MNRTNEGITSHKISVVNEATFSVSVVSLYNQIIAAIETKGSEAISAPNISFFFATSLALTINPPEINPLIADYHSIRMGTLVALYDYKGPPLIQTIFQSKFKK